MTKSLYALFILLHRVVAMPDIGVAIYKIGVSGHSLVQHIKRLLVFLLIKIGSAKIVGGIQVVGVYLKRLNKFWFSKIETISEVLY